MGYLSSKPATRQEPCPLCGKTDHCWSADYGQEGRLFYCAKASDPVVYGRDGVKYLLKDTSAFPGGKSGGYWVYESEEQQVRNRQEYIARKKAENPDWKSNSSWSKPKPAAQASVPVQRDPVEIDKVSPLPNRKLHEIYSFLLNMLVLEDDHKKALLDEWNAGGVYEDLGERILAHWPIRSLPMNDYARKNSQAELKNATRRKIIEAMVERFGSLKGVPGFYLETIRWPDKNTGEMREHTHWQMIGLSGIVYPQYDSDGYIYRIRIGDEHPDLHEFARTQNGQIIYDSTPRRVQNPDGSYGIVDEKKPRVASDILWDKKSGEWFRQDRATKNKEVLYSRQKGISKVEISLKGYPKIVGKVDGKYKNFSSYYQKVQEGSNGVPIAYNGYTDGTQSGSQVSLFTREDDNMEYVYITEGEKKAIVMNEILHCPVIALPGVHTFKKLFEKEYQKGYSIMDRLIQKGLKAVIVVYDADKAVNDAVLSAEEGVINLCKEHKIRTFSGSWDEHYGKGADDILIQGKSLDYYPC